MKLNDVKRLISHESIMITMDDNSLYTNITHTDGINACLSFYDRHSTYPALINDILILIDFILISSSFHPQTQPINIE